MPDTKFDPKQFIKEYNACGKPTQKKIPCSKTGKMVTMFGDNLKKNITKYGTLEKLLANFVSREGKAKGIPVKKAKKEKPIPKTKRLKEAEEEFKNAKEQKREEKARKCEMRGTFKNTPLIPLDLSKQEVVENLTLTACIRPDIFLDSGRMCNLCHHNEFCIAPCKKFGKIENAWGATAKRGKKRSA